jgi:hypothetical protein
MIGIYRRPTPRAEVRRHDERLCGQWPLFRPRSRSVVCRLVVLTSCERNLGREGFGRWTGVRRGMDSSTNPASRPQRVKVACRVPCACEPLVGISCMLRVQKMDVCRSTVWGAHAH